MRTRDERLQVAATIMNQFGGKRFAVMVGAKEVLATDNGVRFKIGKNTAGVNMVHVDLTPMDLYNVRFEKRSFSTKTMEAKIKEVAKYDGVYAEDLADIFVSTTKLYVRL